MSVSLDTNDLISVYDNLELKGGDTERSVKEKTTVTSKSD